MNKECDIIKDLIPLYAENLLSEASVGYVDKHCSSCETCRNELRQACGDIGSSPKETNSREEMWARIAKRERKRERIGLISKIVAIVVATVIMAVIFRGCYWVVYGNTVDNYDEKTYSQMAEKDDIMPQNTELGNYESIRYKYHHIDGMLTDSNAYTVIARYNDSEYKKQKRIILKSYNFRTTKVDNSLNDNPEQKMLEPSFNLGGFEFKLLSETYSDGWDFPKLVYMIGFNDKKNQIAFVKFKDFDIDYIYSYDTFLWQNCGWEWS